MPKRGEVLRNLRRIFAYEDLSLYRQFLPSAGFL
jgi:hypothetical protein